MIDSWHVNVKIGSQRARLNDIIFILQNLKRLATRCHFITKARYFYSQL